MEVSMDELSTAQIELLSALTRVRERLAQSETDRAKRIEGGMSDADASLIASLESLSALSAFCSGQSLEVRSINRLIADVGSIALHRPPSDMLKPRLKKGRPGDHVAVEDLKGCLAAAIEYLQHSGRSRTDAIKWVVRHMPPKLGKALGSPAARTVGSWLERWGGRHGDAGPGGRTYNMALEMLKATQPSNADLAAWMEALIIYQPPQQESD